MTLFSLLGEKFLGIVSLSFVFSNNYSTIEQLQETL